MIMGGRWSDTMRSLPRNACRSGREGPGPLVGIETGKWRRLSTPGDGAAVCRIRQDTDPRNRYAGTVQRSGERPGGAGPRSDQQGTGAQETQRVDSKLRADGAGFRKDRNRFGVDAGAQTRGSSDLVDRRRKTDFGGVVQCREDPAGQQRTSVTRDRDARLGPEGAAGGGK